MQTIADERIHSIEQRLDNMEKHAVTKDTLEKEITVLLKNRQMPQSMTAIIGSMRF